MPINPKLKQIYDTLKEGGADVGSEKEFNDYFQASGKDGYNNRKQVYDTLKEGGADVGKSYEEFAGWLGLHAVNSKPATPRHTVQATKPAPARPVRTQPTGPQQPKGKPMTAAEKAGMISSVGGIVRSTQAGLQRTQNMMTYARGKAGLHAKPAELGQHPNVVETARRYNPKTGKMQPHYLTEAGNEYEDKVQADMEQKAADEQKRRDIDPVQSQLEEAYSERDRLQEAASARRRELEDEYSSRSWYQRVLTEMGKAAHSDMDPAATAADPEHMGFEQDERYMQLMSAIRKNHRTIQTLEDKRNGRMNSFWHSLGTALTNGYTFADGLPEMRDATALLNAQKHIDSINRKRQTGKALTKEEAAAEAVLRNTLTDNVVQDTYGSEYGAWGRAGSGMAQSIDFMKDFLLSPGAGTIAKGVAGKVAGAGGRYLARKAGEAAVKATAKAVARATLKATGVVAGAHAAGAVISNTTGIGRTAARTGKLGAGDVGMDKNGSYKIENRQDLMSAFAEAEREQARENGSEMFGEFIPGGKVLSGAAKKALSKIGLGRISDMLTSIGNKAWYRNYTTLLGKGGYNGIPGEALEEYEGMFFDAITGHADEAVRDFTDPKQQVDIWLGCATMGALMGAVPMGLHIQGYYRYRHGMDRADKTAGFRLTTDKWQPLKEKIDQTDNGNMSGFVVDNILNNGTLEPQEKEAAMNYVRSLTKFRGFNIAQVNNADEAAGEAQQLNGERRQQDEDRQQAYETGREAADMADTEGDRSDADAIVLRMREAYGEIERVFADDAEMRLAQLEDDPWEVMNDQSLTPDQQDAVAYFVNSKAAVDGLNDAVNEKSDNRRDEATRQVEQRTNRQSGMIHPATLKTDDRQVYIVSGNVVMFPDGSAVDVHHSSESVVVCDAETGEMKFMSPEQIYKVDEPIDPNMELQAADEAIKAEQQVVLGNDTSEDSNAQGRFSVNQEAIDNENAEGYKRVKVHAYVEGFLDEHPERVQEDLNHLVPITASYLNGELSPHDYLLQLGYYTGGEISWLDKASDEEQKEEADENAQSMSQYLIDNETAASSATADKNMEAAATQTDAFGDDAGEVPGQAEEVPNYGAASDVQNESEVNLPQSENIQQNNPESEVNLPQNETDVQEPSALNRIPKGDSGEPLLEQTDPETAWDGVVEYMEDADDAQEYVESMVAGLSKDVENAKKAVGKVKTSADMAKFKADKAAARQMQADAEARLDKWVQISNVNKARKQEERNRINNERAEADRIAHEKAVAELAEQKRIEAEKKAEQEAVGTHAVNPKIKEKWDAAEKLDGAKNEMVLPNGEKVSGHYVLTESGAASPSHNATEEFAKTEGFPVDGNGQSVNDRDYERDRDAQKITRDIARNYDSRALQTPVVVSRDGVVLSGNGRTMAGELAAANSTDGEYVHYLKQYPEQFGFTSEQVRSMRHPRVLFVPDSALPYNADTFAKFNQQEMKGQSKTEQSVKLGKIVPDDTFARIVRSINGYDTLGEFYADSNATREAVKELHTAGILNDAQTAEMFDGDEISVRGREILENMLIGKAFESNPDAVREITAYKSVRQSVITALAEIVHNKALGTDYSLETELASAIELVYKARKDHHKAGDKVSAYARQQNLFSFDEGDTVADYTNSTMLMLADTLNDNRSTLLKKTLALYNHAAAESAAGQTDMFSDGRVQTKEEIWNNVKQLIDNGTGAEQQSAIDEATRSRKESVRKDETNGRSNEESQGRVKETDYILSDKKAENGENFYQDVNGNIDLADIPDEVFDKIDRVKAPLRLTPSMLKHVFDRHGKEMGLSRADDAIDFILDVMDNFDHVRQGDKNAVIFSIENGRSRTGRRAVTILLNSESGEYYGIKTSGYERIEGLNKKTLLWEKGADKTSATGVAPANVTTGQAQQGNEPTGSASNHSNGSERKDKKETSSTQAKTDKSAKNSGNRLVSDERYEELKRRMRKKLGQLNMGVDPELLAIGTEMAVYHIEKGARAFGRFAKDMIADLGDTVRPYLKAFYNGARDMPEMEELSKEMTPYEDVRRFDVASIGKDGEEVHPTLLERAEQISNEAKVERNAAEEAKQTAEEGDVDNDVYSITRQYNQKKDVDIWVVRGKERTDKDVYMQRKQRAKAHDGYYSSFRGVNGFVFNSREDAKAFSDDVFEEKKTSTADEIQAQREQTETNPTEAQKEAGNYRKGHIKVDGFGITLENPKGSTRSGKDANGKQWKITMKHDYGYIRGTKGTDGDHIDVYLSDNPTAGNVYVVDQIDQQTGAFDEHKVMYGFGSMEEAVQAYRDQYENGWKVGNVTEVSREEFKKWADSSTRKTKPFADYKGVKPLDTEHTQQGRKQVNVENGLLAEYHSLKEEYPDAKLLFRVGDFYETYQEDAEAVANTLGVTLTKRNDGVHTAGFPYHALDTYLPKLIRAGYRVAICNQLEMPKVTEEAVPMDTPMLKPAREYHGGDHVFSVKHNANKDIFMAHHADGKVKYTFTDGTKANADEVQDALPMENEQTLQPKKVNVESLVRELQEKGKARLSDHAKEVKAKPTTPAKEEKTSTEKEKAIKKNNSKKKSVSLKREPTVGDLFGDLFSNNDLKETENDRSRESHSCIGVGRKELPTSDNVGGRAPVQNAQRDSQGERLRPDNGSGEFGTRPQYDVNKKYSNEEIDSIVSSVTTIKDGKVIITGDVTDDLRDVVSRYVSGGVAKQGRGVLDEYYTDGKIVDAVGNVIAPLLPANKRVRVLEPSVGTGNFLGAVDEAKASHIDTFEINRTTAGIAKILHPNIDVNLRSFETEFIDEEGNKKAAQRKYDVVIGNPPYGAHRGLYKGLGEEPKIARYEDYFVKRSLDVMNDGGVLAMVLPSSWLDRQKHSYNYDLIRAYRLPSGAFAGTKVGTDIIVLKKNSNAESIDVSDYFEKHPERVLGEEKERTGRFGRPEKYIEGNIDAALDAISRDNAIDVAKALDMPTDNDTLGNIQSAIEETGSSDGAKKIVEEGKKESSKSAGSENSTIETKNRSSVKVHLKKAGKVVPASVHFNTSFSDGEVAAFEDTRYDGTIPNWNDHKEHVSYYDGKYMNDFYYAEGDIYERLAQLEHDKALIVKNMGQAQYDKQNKMLHDVLPKRKTIDEITLNPNTAFAHHISIGEEKLIEKFMTFLGDLPRDAFGDSSMWEVRGYLYDEQIYGKDADYNKVVRARRKKVGNDLFKRFLKEELTEPQRIAVENAFNREYNGTYRPDYSKVPMFSKVRKDFKGKELKLTSVQLAGVGRSTVKGVGVLAHEVGFGKTLSGVMAMHEAMTRGNATKPLIVVPNDNIMRQWIETIEEALPRATVNVLGNLGVKYDLSDFKVNDGEFSIVTYEGLKAMSFSDNTYNTLAEDFSYITDDLRAHQSARDAEKYRQKKEELKGKLKKGSKKTYNFEDFGFDYLTFDEAHNANHIVSKVKLDKSVFSDFRSQSQRSSDLGMKTWIAAQYIQRMNNGRNVLLLSATPFTNKPLEYYSILSLVANDTLKRKGFYRVDEFFKTFMEADDELEIAANGKPVRKTNVRRFRNNGLFQDLLGEYIDIKGEEDNPDLIRPERKNKEYKLPQNEEIKAAMSQVDGLLKDNKTVLQGIGLARQVAFTPYAGLGMPSDYKEFVEKSPKIDATIKLIAQNKKDAPNTGQIIYSEVCVDTFPMIREYLIKETGYKDNEVRIITGATSNAERVKIQAAFNSGEIKVVIGSPAIKEGLNLQGNTTDMYILSLPWNFTQLRQIEGRGWRQGNKWKNIRINYMLTEDSVDVFMLQRLQVKQGLYNEAMKKGAETVDVGDIEASEFKAALIKDPKTRAEIKVTEERAKIDDELVRLKSEQGFIGRKAKNYLELLANLKRTEESVERHKNNDYYYNFFKKNVDDYTKKLREEREKLREQGVEIDGIETKLKKIEGRMEALGKQRSSEVEKELLKSLTERYAQEREEQLAKGAHSLDDYLKERAKENSDGFFEERKKGDGIRFREEQNLEGTNANFNDMLGELTEENADPKQAELGEAVKEKKRLDEEYKKLSDEEEKPSANDDTRYRDFDEEVNDRFNEELAGLTEENAQSKRLKLGLPSPMLYSAGVPDKPIILYGNKLLKKAMLHGFEIEDLHDLPLAMQHPIAVFEGSHVNSFATLLELKLGGHNTLASIEVNKKGEADFNIISSLFGKESKGVTKWILDGKLLSVDKEKAQSYISTSALNADATYKAELSSAANIVKDFVNPSIGEEKTSLQGKIDPQDTTPQAKALQAKVLSEKLNTPIRVVSDPEEIAELPSRRQQRAKGWWSAKNDEVVILLPNNTDVADVANTVVHEVVGHKGLRKLIGEERFDEFLGEVYAHASKPIRAAIDEAERKLFDTEVDRLTQQKNSEADRPESRKGIFSRAEATVEANNKRKQFRKEATEEYMADMAGRIGEEGFEKMSAEELTLWGRIKAKVQRFLDKFLRGLKITKNVKLTDKDVAYILYKSWKNMRNGGKPTIMDVVEDALMRSKTNYNELSEEEFMFRDGDSVEYRKAQARNLYEQRVSRGLYQVQEAIQDSMLGVKEAMEAVLKAEGGYTGRIEDVAGYENPYLGENRLSSVNQAECAAFARTLFKPMLEEVAKHAKTAEERAKLTDYMMAKHGIERNDVMARRAAEKVAYDEFWKELRTAERTVANDPLDQDAADVLADVKQRMQDRENELYAENRGRDYAGLTALTGKDDVSDAESEVGQMVSDYEADHDTTALWDKVNAVTKATLQKTYECGIISKATYDDISDMYEHYIPLRGFDEKTSDEAYAYLSDKHSAFNAPIKTAKGRKSKADDPFANMEAMAESAIMQGNRNILVKRKFMRFVQNHPSDLVSISDLWLRYDDVADEWKPVNVGDVKGTERIEEDDTPREVERKMRDFEEMMRQLSESDPDHFKRQKDHPEIPYRVVGDRDLRQHQVLVKQSGKEYVLTINGNPRAAQALNGQTNPDNDSSGALGAILHAGEVINRQLSAFYTTRNPDFVVSNFMRDMLYANTMVWVKESPNYALRFHKNFAKLNPAKMKVLLAKLRKGTLDMNDETEKAFSLFIANGGETGYSNIRDIEQRKNDIRRELSKHNGKLHVRKALSLLGERLDEYNRAVENCARFAAFMTSRQMKRSIDRSIYDAKEISVNFNKKGSGAKFMGATGQTKSGNAAAFVSGLGRSSYVFWNAAIQGTTNFGKQFKYHPVKALTEAAAMFLLGALVAGIAGDDEDDDNKNSYYNLPEYVRRSNVVFRLPGMEETWVSIPLPVEYRALYGMGELMTSTISGKEHYTSGELASHIASQVSQALPLDFMEGGGGFKAFVPSAVKPYAEAMTNKSWTGMPLYKDTPWNNDMPEWTKAYKSANKHLVGLSKVLNEISGGDAYTNGVIDINPAQVEYLLNGYFGGVSSTIDKFAKMGETALGQREYDPRSFLILNRLVKSGDERTEYRHINNEYFRLKQEHDKLKSRLKHYEEDTYNGVFDYAEKINWLNKSPEYQRLEIFEDYSSDINAINKELKEPMNDNERKELEKELYGLKKKLVDEANKTRK